MSAPTGIRPAPASTAEPDDAGLVVAPTRHPLRWLVAALALVLVDFVSRTRCSSTFYKEPEMPGKGKRTWPPPSFLQQCGTTATFSQCYLV